MKYLREERASRASSETLVIKDGTTVERALEIISSGVVIQDLTEAGNIPASAVSSVRKIEGDEEVEVVAVRLGDGIRSWEIRTPKTKRVADDESDCERTLRASRRKGKGRMPGDCLRQLAKDLTSLGEAFPPAPVEEGTARKLFQMGRKVPDSQVQEEDSDIEIEDVLREGYVANEGSGTLRESMHAVKGLSVEEAEEAVRMTLEKADEVHGVEEDDSGVVEEDETMEDGLGSGDGETASGSYEMPSDSRSMWTLVDDIMANLKTMEEVSLIKGGG
ncbi:hypothetical protein EV426DRAFT_711919 [Tirmania nivea]|nr:hypothetical protein EV426DRAFT_711919 [Tirmania nivea]